MVMRLCVYRQICPRVAISCLLGTVPTKADFAQVATREVFVHRRDRIPPGITSKGTITETEILVTFLQVV